MEGKPLPSCCQALRFPGGGGVPQLLAARSLPESALAQARGVLVGQVGLGEWGWVVLSQVKVVLPSVGAGPGQGERVPGLDIVGFRPVGLALLVDLGRLFQGWVLAAELGSGRGFVLLNALGD